MLISFSYSVIASDTESETSNTTGSKSSVVFAGGSGVGALARLEPRSRVINVSHDSGPEGVRIRELKVFEGQTINKGDVIAIFSDSDRKKASLESVRANIKTIESKLKAEKVNAAYFRKELNRFKTLRKTDTISQARLDQAERDFNYSTANVLSLEAELVSAQASLNLAEEEFKQSILTAPIDGTVLKIHSWQGERVGDNGVLEMANLSEIDAVAEIYERDMPKIQVGQKAEISVAGIDQKFSGEVREMGFLVMKNDLNNTDPLADRDNRTIEVRISLGSDAAERLKNLIYMQVDARIM